MSGDLISDKPNELLLDKYIKDVMDKIFDPIPVPIILIDKDTKILVMNRCFLDFLGVKREDAEGKKVIEVDRNSRFPLVFKSKKAEIAWKHTFQNGQTAIVHRIPVLSDSGDVLYGFGLVLFQDMDDFKRIVDRNKLLETELFHYKSQLRKIQGANYSFDNIIGSSIRMSQAKFMASKAANTESTVLILGESGTGKELFAHAIHDASSRSHGAFVKINCAAIPADLLESELFGYVEGAFTGAKKGGKVGKFELSNGGTIFLDEIGDMPLSMQAKLLRVLQEREVERLGSNQTIKLDLRVIAATNQNLIELVKKGSFREDLYYRLNIMSIEVPSLKDRIEDIDSLVQTLIRKISYRLGRLEPKISSQCIDMLKDYHWPGNVRELENVLERSINLVEDGIILAEHISLPSNTSRDSKKDTMGSIRALNEVIAETEKREILRCLYITNGNKKKTARLLNISRSSLYEKIARYEIDSEESSVQL